MMGFVGGVHGFGSGRPRGLGVCPGPRVRMAVRGMDGDHRVNIAIPGGAGRRETELVELVAARAATQEEVAPEDQNVFEKYAGSVGYVWLYFGAFCAGALMLKWARKKQMEMNNEQPKNPTIITTEEMEADLHVFKCGGCGYEMYPARTREFKFFPDNFKCPVCNASREAFWDLNDPNDPRNQEEEEEEEETDEGEDTPNGKDGGSPPETEITADQETKAEDTSSDKSTS